MAEHCKLSVAAVGDGEEKSHGVLTRRSHVLKIDGYSRWQMLANKEEGVISEAFSSCGHDWVLEFYPNGYDETEYIAVHLITLVDDSDVDMKAKFSLLDKDGVPVPLVNGGTYFWQKLSTGQQLVCASLISLRDQCF